MTTFIARYGTRTSTGWAKYDYENEMYADLEVQGLTEEHPSMVGIDYYEMQGNTIVRRWDFGKPHLNDYWRKCQ